MKHFIITGTYVVERTFEADAESEQEARDNPALWDEVEEVTQERTALEVYEQTDDELPTAREA